MNPANFAPSLEAMEDCDCSWGLWAPALLGPCWATVEEEVEEVEEEG